eukprot:2039478-Amphidinium_carterae.1
MRRWSLRALSITLRHGSIIFFDHKRCSSALHTSTLYEFFCKSKGHGRHKQKPRDYCENTFEAHLLEAQYHTELDSGKHSEAVQALWYQ